MSHQALWSPSPFSAFSAALRVHHHIDFHSPRPPPCALGRPRPGRRCRDCGVPISQPHAVACPGASRKHRPRPAGEEVRP